VASLKLEEKKRWGETHKEQASGKGRAILKQKPRDI